MANKKTKYRYFTKTISLPGGGRKYIRGKTQQELDKKMFDAKIELLAGVNIGDNTTVKELGEMWFRLTKSIRKETTQRVFRNALNKHIYPKLGEMKVRDVKPVALQYVMLGMKDQSRALQSQVFIAMNGIFRMALANDLILKSPVTTDVKIGGAPAAEKMSLTKDSCAAILSGVPEGQEHLFVLLALHTGMRRGELCGLMWSDVNFDKRVINVRHNNVLGSEKSRKSGTLKTESAYRKIPITDEAYQELCATKATSESLFVLPAPDLNMHSASTFRTLWNHIISAVPDDVFCTPHTFRHTYATRLFEAGLDIKEVQYLLGHKNPSTTLKIYTHYQRESREADTAKKVRACFGAKTKPDQDRLTQTN